MILRAAQVDDAAGICAICNPIIRDTLITFTTDQRSEQAVVEEIRARGAAFLVAEQGGQIAGFATYAAFRAGPGYAHSKEHSIQLAPNARGQGLGQLLMQRLEQIAADQGVHVLIAGISSANPDAVAFHRAQGFSQVGYMPQVGFKFGTWLDLILMQKILSQGPDGAPDTAAGTG